MAYMRITNIDSYEKLDQWIGDQQTKEVAYKTIARRVETGIGKYIAIKMWNTDIYTIFPDDVAVLDVGQWFTVTTKQRIVDLLPQGLTIDSQKGRWYLVSYPEDYSSRTYVTVFYNGMRINVKTLQVLGQAERKKAEAAAFVQDAKNNVMRRKIRNYVNGLSDEKIKELGSSTSAGDCFFCQLESGLEPGESLADYHIASHVEENYYMRSLLLNALAKRGNPLVCLMLGGWIVRHDLGKYLRKRLLKGVAVA